MEHYMDNWETESPNRLLVSKLDHGETLNTLMCFDVTLSLLFLQMLLH